VLWVLNVLDREGLLGEGTVGSIKDLIAMDSPAWPQALGTSVNDQPTASGRGPRSGDRRRPAGVPGSTRTEQIANYVQGGHEHAPTKKPKSPGERLEGGL
jgi:hypothetical protein